MQEAIRKPYTKQEIQQHRRKVGKIAGVTALSALSVFGVGKMIKDAQPRAYQLPSNESPNKTDEIKQGIEDGKLIIVRTDEGHNNLWNIASTITPEDGDVRQISDELVKEVGTDQVPLGTEVAVPATPSAIELHDQQYPKQ